MSSNLFTYNTFITNESLIFELSRKKKKQPVWLNILNSCKFCNQLTTCPLTTISCYYTSQPTIKRKRNQATKLTTKTLYVCIFNIVVVYKYNNTLIIGKVSTYWLNVACVIRQIMAVVSLIFFLLFHTSSDCNNQQHTNNICGQQELNKNHK